MRIEMFLFVDPPLARQALLRWRALGGHDSAVHGDEAIQLEFLVADRDSPEGRVLFNLATELGTSPSGEARLGMVAKFDESDILKAELLFVEAGTLYDSVDPLSLTPEGPCPSCGLSLQRQPIDSGVRLIGRRLVRYDMFSAELLWFVRTPIADHLRGLHSATINPALVPANVDPFFWLSATSSLGYPCDGTKWGDPCPNCNRRRGSFEGVYIGGLQQYPRRAWDGSDVLVSAAYPNGLFVTQKVWKTLADPQWRVPEDGVAARPVLLLDNAEPVW